MGTRPGAASQNVVNGRETIVRERLLAASSRRRRPRSVRRCAQLRQGGRSPWRIRPARLEPRMGARREERGPAPRPPLSMSGTSTRQVAGDLELREELLQLYAVQLEALAADARRPGGPGEARGGPCAQRGLARHRRLCSRPSLRWARCRGKPAIRAAPELARVVEATRRRVQELLVQPKSSPET